MNISNIMHKVLYIHSQFTQCSLKEVQAVALLKVSSWHFLGLELSIHPSIHLFDQIDILCSASMSYAASEFSAVCAYDRSSSAVCSKMTWLFKTSLRNLFVPYLLTCRKTALSSSVKGMIIYMTKSGTVDYGIGNILTNGCWKPFLTSTFLHSIYLHALH